MKVKSLSMDNFIEFPFFAHDAKAVYDSAMNPIPERGKRVLNDILRGIRERAGQGEFFVSFHRRHATCLIYEAVPIGFKEKWKAYWGEDYLGNRLIRIEMNDADLVYVMDLLTECGYKITKYTTRGQTTSFYINWTD